MNAQVTGMVFASKLTKNKDKAITTIIEAETGNKIRVCAPELVNDGKPIMQFKEITLIGFNPGNSGMHFAASIEVA